MNKAIIVDKNDQIIGYKEYGRLKPSDIYRVSALWLTSSRGDILLAQRSFNKKHCPGLWGPAVAGTNDEGETYLDNIVKETEEEIGLTGLKFEKDSYGLKEGKRTYFRQMFSAVIDYKPAEDFVIQREEVEAVKWLTRQQLADELKSHPEKFVDGFDELFRQSF